jgi:hypothetical protein
MGQQRSPGDFILEAADAGLRVAFALCHFGSSQRIKDLASKISLSATVLTEVGREVNRNADDFKDAIQEKFRDITLRCEKDYGIVLAAIEKANSWTKDESLEETEDPPKNSWKKLLWALGMNEREFDALIDSLDDSMGQATMVQYTVMLVIFQIRGKK